MIGRFRRLALAVVVVACGVDDGVPEGKLARVGEVVLGPEDLAGVKSQLGGYAQLRFAGAEGQTGLLQALVAAELLAQEAREQGLGDDPRVAWARYEEIATLYLNAELERRVPRASVAEDEAALRAYYDAHPELFTAPERRSMRGVVRRDYESAEITLDLLRRGIVQLPWLGEIVTTELQVRDDAEHPGFHPILFDAALAAGDLVPDPVLVGEGLLVGEVAVVEPPTLEPMHDAVVRERLVEAVRAPRLEAARAGLLAELRARFPASAP